EAHNNLGNLLQALGRVDDALDEHEKAIQLRPNDASAHVYRAMAWLLAGNYEQGWPEYEWRWKTGTLPLRGFAQPVWDGSPLNGRTIVLHAEQGLGDTLQFVRYAALVKERGGKVVVLCPKALNRILASCPAVDQVVGEGATLPPFDVHAALMSLPGIF